MSQKVTDDSTAAAFVLATDRDHVSTYQTFSQTDENRVSTNLPKQSLGSKSGKDGSEETTKGSGSTVADNNVAFVLKTAGICLAYFSVVC